MRVNEEVVEGKTDPEECGQEGMSPRMVLASACLIQGLRCVAFSVAMTVAGTEDLNLSAQFVSGDAWMARSRITSTLTGAALGIAGALVMSRWLESMLYQTRARDPLTITIVAGLLIICAVAAALAPSLAAARTDPMTALRSD